MITRSGGRPREIHYLFVDGGYLRKVVESFSKQLFGGVSMPIDFSKLRTDHQKVFYYDCLPPQKRNESDEDYRKRLEPHEERLNEIRYLNLFHVYEGVTSGRGETRARQKQIDVKITVDMLMHAYRGNMHQATLLSGDLDFKPLIDALVESGMRVTLWYEEKSTSKELIYSADIRRELSAYDVHGFCSEDFLEKHPLPIRWAAPKEVEGSVLIEIGKGATGEELEIYIGKNEEGEKEYQLVRDDRRNDGYHFHMTHKDLDFLKRVHDVVEFRVDWKPV